MEKLDRFLPISILESLPKEVEDKVARYWVDSIGPLIDEDYPR